MVNIEQAQNFAQTHRDDFLQQYKELLSIPSISTLSRHKADMQHAAQWIASELSRLKMKTVEILETGGHPAVYAEWLEAPEKPTLLIYGHYDVQPVDPLDEWETPPFEPSIRGDYIYARGASDMKGQFFAQFKAMEALLHQGAYPVNVKYLLEGEEEMGSPHMPVFLDAQKERLQCDAVLNCDAGIFAPDTPSITYALRGLAYFELQVRTARKDMHSGFFGGGVLNPIHVLCDLISGMHDGHGRVTLPGFYEKVRDLNAEEREVLAQVPHDEATWLETAGAKVAYGEEGFSTIERTGARPTLDVNGIWGGFTEPGSKTVLPARASAKFSMRLVPDQQPEDIKGQLTSYLEANMPDGVEWSLSEHAHGPGAVMDRRSPYMKAAAEALETVFGKAPIYTRMGGSVPIVGLMQQILGVDSIMLGFALPGDGIHGPNERQYLPNFYKGIETYIHFLTSL